MHLQSLRTYPWPKITSKHYLAKVSLLPYAPRNNIPLYFSGNWCSVFKYKGLNWIEGAFISIDAGMVDGVPVLLAKPQTYINLSGEAVRNTFERFVFMISTLLYIFLSMHAIHCNWPDSELWWLVKCLWSWHPYLSFFLQAGALAAYYKLPLHRVVVVGVYDPIFLGDTLDWLNEFFAVWVSGIWWHRPAMWSSSFTT